VSKGVNWETFLKLAARHVVRPLVFQTIKLVCWDDVPTKIQHELMRFNKANIQKSFIFTAELLRLLDLFQKNAIAIATFKGPVLAHSAYDHVSRREFSDLDVIVREVDLAKAEKILIDRGYRADFPDRDYRSAFLSYQGQYAFRHNEMGLSVDLHWRLSSKGVGCPIPSGEMWQRLETITIAGRTIPTLARDDLALFLAAHGTKEGWRSLIWVCDFAEFLRKHQDINWAAILDRAQRSHSLRPLLLAMVLASTLLDAPIPATLVDLAWNHLAVRTLAEQAKLRMLRDSPEREVDKFLNGLNTHDRLRNRLLPLATLLTTRTVSYYQAMPLPKSLWRFYHFTRPFRLAGKILKRALRL